MLLFIGKMMWNWMLKLILMMLEHEVLHIYIRHLLLKHHRLSLKSLLRLTHLRNFNWFWNKRLCNNLFLFFFLNPLNFDFSRPFFLFFPRNSLNRLIIKLVHKHVLNIKHKSNILILHISNQHR